MGFLWKPDQCGKGIRLLHLTEFRQTVDNNVDLLDLVDLIEVVFLLSHRSCIDLKYLADMKRKGARRQCSLLLLAN